MLEEDIRSLIQSYNLPTEDNLFDPPKVLESLPDKLDGGSGCVLCKRIIAVVKAVNILDVSFAEAFEKQPAGLLQLLSQHKNLLMKQDFWCNLIPHQLQVLQKFWQNPSEGI